MARKKVKKPKKRMAPGMRFVFEPSRKKAANVERVPANSKGKPCSTERTGCPVQLVWRRGKPALRFCRTKGKPGYLMSVKSVKDAVRKSKNVCRCWEQAGSIDACFVDENARPLPPEFPIRAPLGDRVRRRRRRRR